MPATPPLNTDYERRPYWHATMPALPDRSGKALPDTADAVVIGGGYTGLAAARKLAASGASVVLLEANTLGWGASTRNGGIAHPGYKWGPETMVKRYGRELATRLFADSVEATDFLFRTIRDNDIEAELLHGARLVARRRGGIRGRGAAPDGVGDAVPRRAPGGAGNRGRDSCLPR